MQTKYFPMVIFCDPCDQKIWVKNTAFFSVLQCFSGCRVTVLLQLRIRRT